MQSGHRSDRPPKAGFDPERKLGVVHKSTIVHSLYPSLARRHGAKLRHASLPFGMPQALPSEPMVCNPALLRAWFVASMEHWILHSPKDTTSSRGACRRKKP
jgi:hypothetical protein